MKYNLFIKYVPTSQFAGVGSMEDYDGKGRKNDI